MIFDEISDLTSDRHPPSGSQNVFKSPRWYIAATLGTPARVLLPIRGVLGGHAVTELEDERLVRLLEGLVYLNWMRFVPVFALAIPGLILAPDIRTTWLAMLLKFVSWCIGLWLPCLMLILAVARLLIRRENAAGRQLLARSVSFSSCLTAVMALVLALAVA